MAAEEGRKRKKKENPISTNFLIRFLTNSYRIDSYRTNVEDITSVSQSPLILKRYIERALTRNIIQGLDINDRKKLLLSWKD